MNKLLTVDELALILRKAAASIRSDAHRNPSSLPPICSLPQTKRLLWRESDVESWLSEHVLEPTVSQNMQMKRYARHGRSRR